MSVRLVFCGLFLLMFATGSGAASTSAGTFDLEEIQVTPSPAVEKYLELKPAAKVLDFDVAKDGPRTAILMQEQASGGKVVFWDLNSPESTREWATPNGFVPRALAWHPLGRSFFLSGKLGSENVIYRVDAQVPPGLPPGSKPAGKGSEKGGEVKQPTHTWSAKLIYRTTSEIRRLVPAPRPFAIESNFSGNTEVVLKAYRIFFGLRNQDGTYAIKSVTEDGKREYQAVGSRKGFTTFKNSDAPPSRIEAPSALPLAFHPAGHVLLWEDGQRGFHFALYERDHWEQSTRLSYPGVSGGTLTPTPNGLGLIHWQPAIPGLTFISQYGNRKEPLAAEHTFLSTPSSVADGRGIVGLIKRASGSALAYVPVRYPLADVANAWMFAGEQADRELLSRSGGLLRDLPDDQLYSMYESEAYQCGGYDQSTPTRPYLVTTDVFWELLAAAYEGVFIVKERQQAIPAFWEFIDEASRHFRKAMPDSPWTQVFLTLGAMKKGTSDSENIKSELLRIQKAEGREHSPILRTDNADYGELKPRGHYDSNEEMKVYFKAFKYLTALAGDALPPEDLLKAPPEVKARAHSWIEAYSALIAPSRAPLVWKGEQPPPPYAKHLVREDRLFPLSWGMDNEVLLSTVYHEDWPEPEQVTGPSGPRLIPSGLDVASALGSEFATALLSSEFQKYPPLRKVIEDLRARLAQTRKTIRSDSNIYNPWIAALALQWADDVASPGGNLDRELWRAKRLQTGLASWATLRHATVLVNERTTAECGEAAFEPILLTPPRGYVEADPRTFDAIAALFDSMEQLVKSWGPWSGRMIPANEEGEQEALKQGVTRRLSETAAKARVFKKIAEKEIAGEPLSNLEYEEILNIGRVAEHHFLIFKSLASKELALSNPDPMPKIADVAGGGPHGIPFLMAAVGRPMEWDHIVPYFGRRQIAKGAVYSYYEFTSDQLMNDREWLDSLPSQQHPKWISPFISRSQPTCPPRNPF